MSDVAHNGPAPRPDGHQAVVSAVIPCLDEEAAIALNDASPFRKSVEPGYAAIVAAGKTLAQRNVQFFDATRVFDKEPAHMYMDDCCHYTQAGNYILADFIAASILTAPGPWR